MKTLIYAGGELMTGDAIAAALLEYGAALAETSSAETVVIPVVDESGERSSASILIGPASQIMAVDAHTDTPDLVDDAVVERLTAATRALRPHAGPEYERPDESWSPGF